MKGSCENMFDVSKSSLVTSNIQLDVIKLFNKIRIHCFKTNPATCSEIMTHLSYCIKLFNENKIDSSELISSIKVLLGKRHSDLYYEFLKVLNKIRINANNFHDKSKFLRFSLFQSYLNIPVRKDIEFMNISDCGTSYRLLPPDYMHSICSGRIRNKICNEVLNNSYICFPSMTSEDTTAVASKKNFCEEQMHRLEDERYEVDIYLEINKYAMEYLTNLQKTIDSMSKEEKSKFTLDDSLGSTSAILMRKAIYRIYGDASDNMIEGLKARPKMAIPLVLSRMQEKDKDWNEFHSKFKMAWQERANKLYLPSLDYQGDFSKKDAIFLKRSTFVSHLHSLSKAFLPTYFDLFKKDFVSILKNTKNDYVYDPMIHTQVLHRAIYGNISELSYNNGNEIGPHVTLLFPADNDLNSNNDVSLKDIIDNSNSLIINQINIQSNLTKEDKQALAEYIFHVVGYFFDCSDAKVPNEIIGSTREQKHRRSELHITSPIDRRFKHKKFQTSDFDEQVSEKKIKLSSTLLTPKVSKNENEISSKHLKYKLILGNSYIYMFMRLYHILIDRLTVLKIHGYKSFVEEIDSYKERDDNSNDENEKYSKVLQILLDSSDGSPDCLSNNENRIKTLFTTKAFLWFSIPRIVQQIVKISQQIVCTGLESSKDLLDLFCQYSSSTPSGSGGTLMNRFLYVKKENKYAREAIDFCLDQNLTSFLMIYFRQEGRLLIQLLNTDDPQLFTDVQSDTESIAHNSVSKRMLLHIESSKDRVLSLYEKFIYYPGFDLSLKICPLFLMRNMKCCIRQLTEEMLKSNKILSLKRTHPSTEEILFMNLKDQNKQSETDISNEQLLCHLKGSFREMYRSTFIGSGDIYRTIFEKNYNTNKKTGFLSKKYLFRMKRHISVTRRNKSSLDGIIDTLNKSLV